MEERAKQPRGESLGRGIESLFGSQEDGRSRAQRSRRAAENAPDASDARRSATGAACASEDSTPADSPAPQADRRDPSHAKEPDGKATETSPYRTPRVGDELFFVIKPNQGPAMQTRCDATPHNPSPTRVLAAAGIVASAAIAATIAVAACTIAGVGAVASIVTRSRR